MSQPDPFALGSDRTFVPPTPGGALPTPGGEAPPAAKAMASPAQDFPEVIAGTNPLVAVANPLLNMMAQLRGLAHHPDPAALRDYLVRRLAGRDGEEL